MRSIFEALNIDLQVHNIAQGANDCWPYTLCYENGGFSPDFISWEQSFNCGRLMHSLVYYIPTVYVYLKTEAFPLLSNFLFLFCLLWNRSQDVFETLMRTAARSSAILFFHASGSQKQKDCSPSDQAIPPIDESWRPNTANNSGNCKRYAPNQDQVEAFRLLSLQYIAAGSPGNQLSLCRYTLFGNEPLLYCMYSSPTLFAPRGGTVSWSW